MASSWKLNQLDFRFADEEDAEDIKSLINTVYVHEEDEQGECGFRPVGDPKINLSDLIDDFESPTVRWLLLETPRPEESVIAALRMNIRNVEGGRCRTKHSVVDLYGSLEPPPQCSVLNMLLNRAETVCRSLGHAKMVFEVPNWSEDRQRWLEGCGYSDLGGHAWPEDRQDEVTRYTMVLEYEKLLTTSSSIETTSSFEPPTREFPPPPIPASVLAGVDECISMSRGDEIYDSDAERECKNGGSGGIVSDPMFPLISDLFTALHAEANSTSTQQNTHLNSSTTESGDVCTRNPTQGQRQELFNMEEATVEVIHAGGSFMASGDLTSTLSSLPLSSDSSVGAIRQEQCTPENDQLTNVLGDLFSALHMEANDIANGFPKEEEKSI